MVINKAETVTLIEEIKTDGHSPMKFICSDENIYYVKYRSGKSFNKNELVFLFYETLCSKLLQYLHVPTPSVALISINEGSFNPNSLKANKRYTKTNVVAFGSKEISNSQLITDFEVVEKVQDFQKIINPLDLIKIAIFDLWVDNNDRGKALKIGGYNYNLLFAPSLGKQQIIAFDHAFTFGGEQSIGIFSKDLPISVVNKLPNSPLFHSIVRFLDREDIENTIQKFIYECKNLGLHDTLTSLQPVLPPEWYVFPQLSAQLEEFLSSHQRLDRIETTIKNALKL
jgi:hypothetical protein